MEHALGFRCPCGKIADGIDIISLNEKHEMVFRWVCQKCNAIVQHRVGLNELWNTCPEPKQIKPPVFSPEDWKILLHDFHIAPPDP